MDLDRKVASCHRRRIRPGRATVKRFVANGAKAAIFDMNEDEANDLVDELGEDRSIFCNVNVTDEESVKAGIAATMEEFGAIHICCNFAGTGNAMRTMGKNGPFPLDAVQSDYPDQPGGHLQRAAPVRRRRWRTTTRSTGRRSRCDHQYRLASRPTRARSARRPTPPPRAVLSV